MPMLRSKVLTRLVLFRILLIVGKVVFLPVLLMLMKDKLLRKRLNVALVVSATNEMRQRKSQSAPGLNLMYWGRLTTSTSVDMLREAFTSFGWNSS